MQNDYYYYYYHHSLFRFVEMCSLLHPSCAALEMSVIFSRCNYVSLVYVPCSCSRL
jgi:hypothetical protein